MVWLGIDYVKAVQDYGDRIFHAHAKDMEIVRDRAGRSASTAGVRHARRASATAGGAPARRAGARSTGRAFITALIEVGYKGNSTSSTRTTSSPQPSSAGSRHEEDIVANYGTERKGLQLGYNHLSALIA